MHFRAIIRRPSYVFNQWRAAPRLGGKVEGVAFRWDGKDYVSVDNPLPADDVAALLHNRFVQLVVTTGSAGVVELVEEPQPEPEAPVEAEDGGDDADDPGPVDHPQQMPRRRGRPPKNRGW